MSVKYLGLAIIGLGIIAGGIFLLAGRESPPLPEGVAFAEYTPQTLDQYKGRAVIANTWAMWCPFCVEELKVFARVQREFGDELVILAINRQESPARVQEYVEDLGVADDLTVLLDPSDSFYRQELRGFSMPETLFIDREGNVQFHKRGPMDEEEIRQRLEQIL